MLAAPSQTVEESDPGVEHQIELTAETLWEKFRAASREPSTRRRSGRGSPRRGGGELTDDAFTLAVPNDFTREWIEGHFLGLIRAAVQGRDRPRAPRPAHGPRRRAAGPTPTPDGATHERRCGPAPEPASATAG